MLLGIAVGAAEDRGAFPGREGLDDSGEGGRGSIRKTFRRFQKAWT